MIQKHMIFTLCLTRFVRAPVLRFPLQMSPVGSDWSGVWAITSSLGNKNCVTRLHHHVTEEKAGISSRRFRQLRIVVSVGELYKKWWNTRKEMEKRKRSALIKKLNIYSKSVEMFEVILSIVTTLFFVCISIFIYKGQILPHWRGGLKIFSWTWTWGSL